MLSLSLLLACTSPSDGEDTDVDTGEDTDSGPAAKPDFRVCGDGDFTDIQPAIDASQPGDWISVCPGTYGPIRVGWSQDVTISSTGGPDETRIDAGRSPAVIVKDGTLTLDGFSVTGTAHEDEFYPEAAAFSVHEGDLTVSDSRVSGTTGSFTVLFDENFLALDNVIWEDNDTQFLWYLAEGDHVDLLNNRVIGGNHESVVSTPDLDSMLMANNVFAGARIATAFTAFQLTPNEVGEFRIYNNTFYDIDDADPFGGRVFDLEGADFRNNIVTENNTSGLYPFLASYSIFWENGGDYAGNVSGAGNQFVDPELADPGQGDFTAGSAAIDAGDPGLLDADGSRSDIGDAGGPYRARPKGSVEPPPAENITGTVAHTLTVENGFGGGSYLAGEVVHVWADVNPQAELAIGWSGAVADPDEWSSTFVMPDADATLSASVSPADLPLTEATYRLAGSDRSVLIAMPASPRGLVLFYHSARGNNTEIRGNAASTIARLLYAHGYAVIAMDSSIATITGKGGWGDGMDRETLDLAATKELLNELAVWEKPVIAWGINEGARFAHTVGRMVPADAVVSFGAAGRRFTVESTSAPTAWFLPERDSTWRNAEAEAVTWAAAMNARGVRAEVHVHRVSPLYDERFTRVAGIDAAKSKQIADALRARGDVAADGTWLVRGEQAADLDGLGVSGAQGAQVAAEIKAMAADDALYDEDAVKMLLFLNSMF